MVIGMPLSGYLSSWFGWTASFYFYGKEISCILMANIHRKKNILYTAAFNKFLYEQKALLKIIILFIYNIHNCFATTKS